MSRRYLTLLEAETSLSRGKTVEIFLGPFTCNSEKCIRWASLSKSEAGVAGNLWEVFDQGSIGYVDVYTFDSPSGEYYEPIKSVAAETIKSAALELGIKDFNFINQGIVQEEYADFLSSSI